jgi:hypothetical protein
VNGSSGKKAACQSGDAKKNPARWPGGIKSFQLPWYGKAMFGMSNSLDRKANLLGLQDGQKF